MELLKKTLNILDTKAQKKKKKKKKKKHEGREGKKKSQKTFWDLVRNNKTLGKKKV